jgi:hypothetical protein
LLPPQLLQRLRFQCASGVNSRQLRARFQAPAISWPRSDMSRALLLAPVIAASFAIASAAQAAQIGLVSSRFAMRSRKRSEF